MKKITVFTLLLGLLFFASCNTTKNKANEEAALKTQQEAQMKAKADQLAMEEAKQKAAAEAEAKAREMAKAEAEKAKKAAANMTEKEKMKSKADSAIKGALAEMKTPGKIGFAAANDRYSAEGEFKSWKFNKVSMQGDNMESLTASILIDLTSIHEKNPKLTDHLKAPDFFNIAVFKEATLDISNVKNKSGDMYTADMVLNMKGLTQKMMSEFTVTSMDPLHVTGTAQVNRVLFGLGGEIGVGDMVTVTFDTDVPMK